jgi:hypothetical protein
MREAVKRNQTKPRGIDVDRMIDIPGGAFLPDAFPLLRGIGAARQRFGRNPDPAVADRPYSHNATSLRNGTGAP